LDVLFFSKGAHLLGAINEKESIVKTSRVLSLIILVAILASNNAHAFFFFFIPGSVTGKIADAFTGAEGENCVGEQTKVGDHIKLPNGELALVKSLSGMSSRCNQPERPIRALLSPIDVTSELGLSGIEIPEGWQKQTIPPVLKTSGVFFYARNSQMGASVAISDISTQNIPDIESYIAARAENQVSRLSNAHSSGIEKLVVKGFPAWRFEVQGIVNANGADLTYLTTIIQFVTPAGENKLVYVNSWMTTKSYASGKEALSHIPEGLSGINSRQMSFETTP